MWSSASPTAPNRVSLHVELVPVPMERCWWPQVLCPTSSVPSLQAAFSLCGASTSRAGYQSYGDGGRLGVTVGTWGWGQGCSVLGLWVLAWPQHGPAMGAARLVCGCWGCVGRMLLQAQGCPGDPANTRGDPGGFPAPCIPSIPHGQPQRGSQSPIAGAGWADLPDLSCGLPPAGPPSPAHGSQRDQVHRAGRGE